MGLAEVWVPFSSVQGEGSAIASSICVVISFLLLTLRRRIPLIGLGVLASWMITVHFLSGLVLFWGGFAPMVLAVFGMARYGRGREPYIGAAAGVATLLSIDLFLETLQDPGEILFHWLVFTVAWSFGFGLSGYERRAHVSTQRAIAAEVAAAEQAMAAVVAERTRIARELHDVIAHSVSVMVVQAGAAEQVVGEDDEVVRRALATIRATGKEALAEMRHVVEILRGGVDEPSPGLSPQPGLGALSRLVDAVRASGLEVSLTVEGEPQPLPAGLDLAAYRVVQEALTNVRKHAGVGGADLRLTWDRHQLEIEVSDDGPGASAGRRGRGHGLVGMRERVGLYGGSLDVGVRETGGFGVNAVLPLDDPVSLSGVKHQTVDA